MRLVFALFLPIYGMFSFDLLNASFIQAAASLDDILRVHAQAWFLCYILHPPSSVLSSPLDVSCVLLPFCVGIVPPRVSISHF